MKIELRDDINKKDLMLFMALLIGLTLWTIFVFYTGCILTDNVVIHVCR